MKKWFVLLLTVLMLCTLVGCGDKADTDGKDAPTTTTTTVRDEQAVAPLTPVEGEAPEGSYWHVDDTVESTNCTVVLRANTDLTNLCFLELGADEPIVEQTLHVLPAVHTGDHWAIETYINDAVPNRGIACTDKNGKTYYYAFTWSGKDGSIRLTPLDIAALSAERSDDIEAFLNDEENNGFVSMNEYSRPEEVSLHDALYDIGVRHGNWTDAQTQAYMKATGQTDKEKAFLWPVYRHDRAETEALIQKKMGVSITLTQDNMKMRYIEELDAFFAAHTDTQYQPVRVLHGWSEGNEGRYVIDYEIGYMGRIARVTLKPAKDGYQFVSNHYFGTLPQSNIIILPADQRDAMEDFFNAKENNGFVATTYACPQEISLYHLLYDGAGIGVGSWEWTDEEKQDYMTAIGWEEWYTSATRFKRSDIEALLQEKLGISLSDLTKDVDMLYMEKYDAYYHAHNDTEYQLIEVESGYISGDRCVVEYKTRQSESFDYEWRRLIFDITEDSYRFVSNQNIYD